MKKQKKSIGIFLVVSFLVSQTFFSVVSAQSYFDQILAGVSKIGIVRDTIGRFGNFKENVNFWNFGKLSEPRLNKLNYSADSQVQSEEIESVDNSSTDENIFLGEEKDYFPEQGSEEGELVLTKEEKEKLEKESKERKKREKEAGVLARVLEKLGLVRSSATPTTTQVATANPNTLSNLVQPLQQSPVVQNPFLPQAIPANNNVKGSQNGFSPYAGNALQQYLPAGTPQMLSTPYTGPGGTVPGECGIPKGPWAYNIGGNSVSCDARVIVKPFRSQDTTGISKDKVWLAGYVNPAVQKDLRSKFPSPTCGSSAGKYGEGCFADYSSGAGQAYVQWQLLHWQEMGDKVGQKCVPIDIDNCDAIGTKNYLAILDQIEKINNKSGKSKLLVLNKNPHNNCDFMSHTVVGGAFVEISKDPVGEVISKVNAVRKKPEQILVFARGGTGSNDKVTAAWKSGIKNSAFSFDKGKEYERVDSCTYNP